MLDGIKIEDFGRIHTVFDKPTTGYFDGTVSECYITPETFGAGGCEANPTAKMSVKWGSWALNQWWWRGTNEAPATAGKRFAAYLRGKIRRKATITWEPTP